MASSLKCLIYGGFSRPFGRINFNSKFFIYSESTFFFNFKKFNELIKKIALPGYGILSILLLYQNTSFMKTKIFVLQFVSVTLILTGLVRVFANESTFKLLRNNDLWFNDVMILYFFKATGGFILFHGIVFYGISKDFVRFRSIFGPYSFGLLVAGTVMLIVGYLNFLPIWLYASDAIICYILAIFCFYERD